MINLDDALTIRIMNRLKGLTFDIKSIINEDTFYIGGNSLNYDTPLDYDLYPVTNKWNLNECKGYTPVHTSPNAHTFNIKFKVVQFCNYLKPSLKELIDSFDYSHIQIGAKIRISNKDANMFVVEEIYMSEAYKTAQILGTTEYLGSDFPLSSLIRCFKYVDRGNFVGKSYIKSVVYIIHDIIKRGYANYPDFKEQINAIDIRLLDDLDEDSQLKLLNFYNMLCPEDCKLTHLPTDDGDTV